jgi:hypothetical protein
MSSLATIRAAVRKDLHDEDAAAYVWTDAVLDRHIKRALLEYSHASPLEKKTTLVTVPGTRDVSVSSLNPLMAIVAVEWPTNNYPPEYVPFTLWVSTLTLDVVAAPTAVENVNVFWHAPHTINGTVSFPDHHDDIIAVGGAGYAAHDLTSFTSNRVNVGGEGAWGRYIELAKEYLKRFAASLRELPATNTVKTSQMYTPAQHRARSQTTDPGPL